MGISWTILAWAAFQAGTGSLDLEHPLFSPSVVRRNRRLRQTPHCTSPSPSSWSPLALPICCKTSALLVTQPKVHLGCPCACILQKCNRFDAFSLLCKLVSATASLSLGYHSRPMAKPREPIKFLRQLYDLWPLRTSLLEPDQLCQQHFPHIFTMLLLLPGQSGLSTLLVPVSGGWRGTKRVWHWTHGLVYCLVLFAHSCNCVPYVVIF